MSIVWDDEKTSTPNKIVWDDELPAQQRPGLINETLKAISPASILGQPQNIATRAMEMGPSGLANTAMRLAQFGSGELANYQSGKLQEAGLSPTVSNIVTTPTRYAADIVSSIQPLEVDVNTPAKSFMEHALGLSKRHLGTEGSRKAADAAAEVAIEKGIMPALGNPEVAFAKAKGLAAGAGRKIGEALESVPANSMLPVPQGISIGEASIPVLDDLRQTVTKGLKGGYWDELNSTIDKAQDTFKAVLKLENPTLKDLNDAKAIIADKINWLTDKADSKLKKRIVGAIGSKITDLYANAVAPEVASKFISDKRTYGAAMSMIQGLNNKLSMSGNMPISLPSIVAMAAETGPGSIPLALAKLGLFEAGKRRGAAITSNILQRTPSALPSLIRALGLINNRVEAQQ